MDNSILVDCGPWSLARAATSIAHEVVVADSESDDITATIPTTCSYAPCSNHIALEQGDINVEEFSIEHQIVYEPQTYIVHKKALEIELEPIYSFCDY